MSKMKYYYLNESGTLTRCPLCDFVNDDSSEMIDHLNQDHGKNYELYVVKSLENDRNVIHLAKNKEEQ